VLELVCDRETVTEALTGSPDPVCARQLDGIACRVDGRVVAAFGFEHYNGSNVDVHLAVQYPAPAWVRAVVAHVESLNVRRITAQVHAGNAAVRRLLERMGAEVECVCKYGYEDGDAVRYVLWTQTPAFQSLRRFLTKHQHETP
jgi:RimJ/RimL family protein N-acetyltransferase